jgi:hypothetical protein
MSEGLDSPTVFRLGQPTLGVPVMTLDYRSGANPPTSIPFLARQGRLSSIESRLATLEATPDLSVLHVTLVALESRVYTLEHPTPWYRRLARWFRALWWSISGQNGEPPA